MSDVIKEAFFAKCKAAELAHKKYVCLYANEPFYGGPEEGGWWGHDTILIAWHEVPTIKLAKAIMAQIEILADELSEEAKIASDQQCLHEMEWLDARGLEADYLPEVDGPRTWYVVIENKPGELEHKGCRHYE